MGQKRAPLGVNQGDSGEKNRVTELFINFAATLLSFVLSINN